MIGHFTGTIHSVPHMLARLFLVEEGIAATVARDRLRFTLAVRVSWDFSEYCENLRNFVDASNVVTRRWWTRTSAPGDLATTS